MPSRSVSLRPRSTRDLDNAPSVLVPILEDFVGWDAARIRRLFESYGLVLQEWHKVRTDWVTFRKKIGPGAGLAS